jgi:hypothetical protein
VDAGLIRSGGGLIRMDEVLIGMDERGIHMGGGFIGMKACGIRVGEVFIGWDESGFRVDGGGRGAISTRAWAKAFRRSGIRSLTLYIWSGRRRRLFDEAGFDP